MYLTSYFYSTTSQREISYKLLCIFMKSFNLTCEQFIKNIINEFNKSNELINQCVHLLNINYELFDYHLHTFLPYQLLYKYFNLKDLETSSTAEKYQTKNTRNSIFPPVMPNLTEAAGVISLQCFQLSLLQLVRKSLSIRFCLSEECEDPTAIWTEPTSQNRMSHIQSSVWIQSSRQEDSDTRWRRLTFKYFHLLCTPLLVWALVTHRSGFIPKSCFFFISPFIRNTVKNQKQPVFSNITIVTFKAFNCTVTFIFLLLFYFIRLPFLLPCLNVLFLVFLLLNVISCYL